MTVIDKNEGGNEVIYQAMKTPPIVSNRDMVIMRHRRATEHSFESMQRSTTHRDKPVAEVHSNHKCDWLPRDIHCFCAGWF